MGSVVLAALGLAVLMVVHEGGHFLAARHFGMRVVKFSIGFGPTLWKHRPKGSATVYQVAIIPFLAYVQIAGMNPYEENDPKDPGSYMNASLWGRVATIAAGPVANYLFASILFFTGFMIAGRPVIEGDSMQVSVDAGGPAATADVRSGDKIVSVGDQKIGSWDELVKQVGAGAGKPLDLTIERDGATLKKTVTPGSEGEAKGKIMVRPYRHMVPVSVGEAAKLSLVEPPSVVYGLVQGIARMIAGKEKPELSGPVGIVRETAKAVEQGPGWAFSLLGALSAYLGGFNLLPIPALDGGRLIFLGFEAVSRRKPDAKVEAHVHALGLIMMLTLILFVSWFDVFGSSGAGKSTATPPQAADAGARP